MTEFIFTFTSITALVLLAYAVEKVADSYEPEVRDSLRYNEKLNSYNPDY